MSTIYSVLFFLYIINDIQKSINQQDWIIWLISFLAIEAVPEWNTSEQSVSEIIKTGVEGSDIICEMNSFGKAKLKTAPPVREHLPPNFARERGAADLCSAPGAVHSRTHSYHCTRHRSHLSAADKSR